MVKLTVKIVSMQDADKFNKLCSKFDCDMNLQSGKYYVDAKSIMGIFSLDLSKPLILNADTDDEAKVKETASLQGRFFVVGQLVSEFPSPFLDNNLFFVQTKSSVHSGCFQPFHVLVHFPVSHFGIKLRGLNTHVPHHFADCLDWNTQ